MDTDTREPWMPAISSGSVWLYKIDFISWSSQNLWSKQSFGQHMKYLLVWNWVPLGKMINFGSLAQRNALDQWSNDPSLDRADQWSNESLSRVDLIDPWSENGFARKERHRWETLIQILPKERTLWLPPAKESLIDLDILVFWMQNSWKVFLDIMQKGKKTHLLVSQRLIHLWIYMFTLFMQLI